MTNEQIVAIAAPMAFNGVLIGLLTLYTKTGFDREPEIRRHAGFVAN
jgi:hypothetical protein